MNSPPDTGRAGLFLVACLAAYALTESCAHCGDGDDLVPGETPVVSINSLPLPLIPPWQVPNLSLRSYLTLAAIPTGPAPTVFPTGCDDCDEWRDNASCTRGTDNQPLNCCRYQTFGALTFATFFNNTTCGLGCDTPRTDDYCEDKALVVLWETIIAYYKYSHYGFCDPFTNASAVVRIPILDVQVYNSNGLCCHGSSGYNPTCGISIDAPHYRCDDEDGDGTDDYLDRIRRVVGHELFHAIEYMFCAGCDPDKTVGFSSLSGTGWVWEGSASCFEDRLWQSLDMETRWGFYTRARDYLAAPSMPLFNVKHPAALFWAYCCERFGTDTDLVLQGADFMLDFWRDVKEHVNDDRELAARDSFQRTISSLGGPSFNTVFLDFAICNYLHRDSDPTIDKDYDLDKVPDARFYDYEDEGYYGEGSYPTVAINDTLAVPDGTGAWPDPAADDDLYSSQYFEVDVAGTPCQAISVIGTSLRYSADAPERKNFGDKIGWAVVAIGGDSDGDGLRDVLSLSKTRDSEFARTFLVGGGSSVGIEKLAVVVAKQDQLCGYDLRTASGDLSLEIRQPVEPWHAYPGPSGTPERFLIQLYVDGPEEMKPDGAGDRAILGLQAVDFGVRVGGKDADVFSSAYVGSQYWLVVKAPEQDADGQYDLTVSLCSGAISATSPNAVVYGENTINHMIVLDRSGSMNEPAASPKLEAAKIAGELYVDSVRGSDRIGLVLFDGDDAACNYGDVDVYSLETADSAHRATLRSALDSTIASGFTSIGDGLGVAQDEMGRYTESTDLHFMALLSDGMETEARYVISDAPCLPALPDLQAGGTSVYSVAFGPQSNQTLMQAAAYGTNGAFTYVDVETSGPTPPDLAMVNELSEAYMTALQRGGRLERFHQSYGTIPAEGLDIEIEVTETGIEGARFFFSVADTSAGLTVDLRNPNGNPPPGTVYSSGSHAVFHLQNPPITGTWTARLTSAVPTEYVCGLVGKSALGVQLLLAARHSRTGGLDGTPDDGMFEQGIPITILAVLTDRDGPILGADVSMFVELADNSLGCGAIVLHDDGDHADGPAGDGVYGAIFTRTGLGSDAGVFNDPNGSPDPGERGSYVVKVQASGLSNRGELFFRSRAGGFQVRDTGRDQDGDGLPDTWEIYFGSDPLAGNAMADPDHDGLTHMEEFDLGTNPFDSDSDNDGEVDGSEVDHGRCPIDPLDAVLAPPLDVTVRQSTGEKEEIDFTQDENRIQFSWRAVYQEMRIYRAIGHPRNFEQIATVSPTPENPIPVTYIDTDVSAGLLYFYRVQAFGKDGAESRRSPIVSSSDFRRTGQVRASSTR